MIDFSELEGIPVDGPVIVERMDFPKTITLPSAPPAVIDYKAQLAQVRRDFDEYQGEFNEMIRIAKSHMVIDQLSADLAVELGTQAQGLKRRLEKRRDFIVEEPNSFVTGVRNITKTFTDALKQAMDDLSSRRDTFLKEDRERKALARIEAEKAARELQDRLNREAREKAQAEAKAKAEAEAFEKGLNAPVEIPEVKVEPIVIPAPYVEETQTTVRAASGSGTAYQREGKWTFDVLEINRVPADLLSVNKVEINKLIKAGVREIPGLRIYQEEAKTMFKSR